MKLPEIWELDVYGVEDKLFPGALVFDVGANVGQFSEYCLERGAVVIAVEPYPPNIAELRKLPLKLLEFAVGAVDGACEVKTSATGDKSLGAYTVEGNQTQMVSLKTLLKNYDKVDIMKVDIEGAEYSFLTEADTEDLKKIDYLAVEYHAWTDKENNEGLGLRPEPMPYDATNNLLNKLKTVFDVTVVGDYTGGYFLCG